MRGSLICRRAATQRGALVRPPRSSMPSSASPPIFKSLRYPPNERNANVKSDKVSLSPDERAAIHANLGSSLKGGNPPEILLVIILLLTLLPPSHPKPQQ